MPTARKIRNVFYCFARFASSDGALIILQIELNTKNPTKRQQSCRLVEFLVFISVHQLIRVPSDEVYRVGNGGPDHAVVPHIPIKIM